MNQSYKKIISPIQPQMGIIDIRNENHPVQDEIKRFCGASYNIEVSFEEDIATLNHFRHIPGLVAILCTMKQNGQLFAFGRSCSVLNRLNKYLEKTISTVINGSFLSAANNATKVFEALRISGTEDNNNKSYEINKSYQESEPASEKQKNYLRELIKTKVTNENERNQLKLQIEDIDKEQASEMISSLLINSK